MLSQSRQKDIASTQEKLPITTEVVQGKEALISLAEDWDDLFSRAVDASPYLSRVWVSAIIEEGWLQGTPLFVLVRCGEKLIAMFALAVRNIFGVRTACPIGTGQSTCLGVMTDPNYPSAIESMAECFVRGEIVDVLLTEDFSSEDSATNELVELLSRNKFVCFRVYRNPCHQILLGCSYDDYLAQTRSIKRRKKLRYEERRLFNSGDVAVHRYIEKEITPDVLGRIAAIQEGSWMKRRGAAVLGQRFYQKLLLDMARAGFGNVWLMMIDGQDAAFAYALVSHKKLHYYRTAFSLNFESSLSVGKILTMQVLRDACNDGMLSFDFGQGDGEYKRFWANSSHKVYRVVAGRCFRGKLIALCYFAIWRLAKIKGLHSLYRGVKRRVNIFKQIVS
ncbi:MAG: GNAT family N-acetyltransferase [Phycisphaerae bacterium]|nr:GNAT family N-acetyltransferase [Phycisphaerae bacterium]